MSTPASTSVSYCSASAFVSYYDWRTVGDLVSDAGTRSTLPAVLADSNLAMILLAASGRVESAAFRGGRYVIDPVSGQNDLASLTGASKAILQKLVADLAFGFLFERRPNPGVEPPISYQLAIQTLELLADGQLIFGLLENMAAGRQQHHVEDVNEQLGRNTLVARAARYYGRRYSNQRNL